MAKGRVVLRVAGILLIIFGVLSELWAMLYGFTGALEYSETNQHVLTGLLVLYGLYGILTAFFQIAVGAVGVRQSGRPEHATRCIVWGIIVLLLGTGLFILLNVTGEMIPEASRFAPTWYGRAIVIIAGFVLPAFMILGGILNKIGAKHS